MGVIVKAISMMGKENPALVRLTPASLDQQSYGYACRPE
jgi:hypothetical protein